MMNVRGLGVLQVHSPTRADAACAVQMSALEFSRDRKMMSVLARQGTSPILFSKGAPEALLPRCTQVQASTSNPTNNFGKTPFNLEGHNHLHSDKPSIP